MIKRILWGILFLVISGAFMYGGYGLAFSGFWEKVDIIIFPVGFIPNLSPVLVGWALMIGGVLVFIAAIGAFLGGTE